MSAYRGGHVGLAIQEGGHTGLAIRLSSIIQFILDPHTLI
jgi:hypothetical protein